jgi:capsid assembly protease
MFEVPQVWAGTQEALDLVLQASAEAVKLQAARAGADPFELPPLVAIQDGVGVVDIKGPLISGSAGFMRLFGITGYSDIQEALGEVMSSSKVKSILLSVASGGGAVAGADETSLFIRRVSAVKPVFTYAGGNMASAALWLGSAGIKRYASATSIVGSLGVLLTHVERSEGMKKDGYGVTVMRSGKYKALANSLEPLSDLAKQELQAQVDGLNDIFEARIAENYGVSARTVSERMGQGREFLGTAAVKAGLLEGIASFDEAFLVAKMGARS